MSTIDCLKRDFAQVMRFLSTVVMSKEIVELVTLIAHMSQQILCSNGLTSSSSVSEESLGMIRFGQAFTACRCPTTARQFCRARSSSTHGLKCGCVLSGLLYNVPSVKSQCVKAEMSAHGLIVACPMVYTLSWPIYSDVSQGLSTTCASRITGALSLNFTRV